MDLFVPADCSRQFLVKMTNSSCQSKRAKSLQDGGVDTEYPQYNFEEAKENITDIFIDFRKYLEDCNKFAADFRIADESERDIEKFSSGVRLSNVAFKLHDIDVN